MRLRTVTATLLISSALFFITMPPARSALVMPTVDSADVAAIAAKALADSGNKDAIPVLRRMLNHPSIIVRYYAAYGLGKLGDKDSIPALKASLWLPENDTPEDLAGLSMTNFVDGPRRLTYAYRGYRLMACWALRQLGDTSADKRFAEILEDQNADPKKRQEAFECLAQLGSEEAFKVMCKVAENDKMDFVAGTSWGAEGNVMDGGLTIERRQKIVMLAANNKNLPEDRRKYYAGVLAPSVPAPDPMQQKIDAAKGAEALKDLFIAEQKAGSQRLDRIIYAMGQYELGEVEDWMLKYISDSRDKNVNDLNQGVSQIMIYVLRKGTDRCLPLLQSLLEDDKLDMGVRANVFNAIHVVLGRSKPERRDLQLQAAGAGANALEAFLDKDPDDAKFLIESSKMKREEVEDKMLEVLNRPVPEPATQNDIMRDLCFQTLLAWKSPKLLDRAIATLEKSDGHNDGGISQAFLILKTFDAKDLKTFDAKDKLPALKKFYERTHFDRNGTVTRTMYLLGDKDVPKMVLAEAKAGTPDKDTLECDPYLRLLMYEDPDCQKFFFDALMEGRPGLERLLNDMLINYAVGYGIASNPVNFELAAPAIEKILLTSPNTFRAFFLSRLSESTHSEPAVQHAIQRFAEHAMDVSDQARKLIPHLFDADEDARKRAREELEKLGPDAAPACEEALKQYQEPFKKLLDSYKASNTDY